MKLIVLLAFPALSFACSCAGPFPACEAFTKFPTIFHGTVVAVTVDGMRVKADFVVSKGFRGDVPQQLSVYTNSQSSACGVEFKKGLEYLVYANSDPGTGQLSATTCSRTHRLEPGAIDEDLAWLRHYPTAPPTATVFGRQFLQSDFGFQKMTVKIRGPQDRDIITGPDGKYAVEGLPPGDYTISATVPEGLVTNPPRRVHLEPKGCTETIWFIASDTHIRGRLLQSDGKPFPGMQIELIRPGEFGGISAETAADGAFDFAQVAYGDYYLEANWLGPNPTRPWSQMFYRNSEKRETATRIHLEAGHSLDHLDITMGPPLQPLVFPAKILLPDGSPARNLTLRAYDTEHRFVGDPPTATTDANGEADLPLFLGREYYLEADVYTGCVPPARFTAKADLGRTTFQVKAGLRDCRPPRQ